VDEELQQAILLALYYSGQPNDLCGSDLLREKPAKIIAVSNSCLDKSGLSTARVDLLEV
jgi:hypothetical protein